jgi:hypothetical protein
MELGLISSQINMLMWVMGLGFASLGSLMLYLNSGLNTRMAGIENRMDKIDEKLTDVDRRLCRMEGAFSRQDCCMLNNNKHSEKVS